MADDDSLVYSSPFKDTQSPDTRAAAPAPISVNSSRSNAQMVDSSSDSFGGMNSPPRSVQGSSLLQGGSLAPGLAAGKGSCSDRGDARARMVAGGAQGLRSEGLHGGASSSHGAAGAARSSAIVPAPTSYPSGGERPAQLTASNVAAVARAGRRSTAGSTRGAGSVANSDGASVFMALNTALQEAEEEDRVAPRD